MIKKIDINFSFGKLARSLDQILENHIGSIKKVAASSARKVISSGSLEKLSPGTLYIRKHGLSPKRPYKTNSKTPLVHTGSLLASIKEVDEGISMAGYGKYHLQDYTIVDNKFTDYMMWRHSMYMVGTKVPARNPFIDKKGNLRGESKEVAKKSIKGLYKNLNKAMRH